MVTKSFEIAGAIQFPYVGLKSDHERESLAIIPDRTPRGRPDVTLRILSVLTDVESIRGIALRSQREAIVVLVRLQMPDAALKSGPHRKSLQTGRVSGTANEERLAERNSREQALQLKPEFSGYTCAAAHSAIATV